MGLLGWTAGIAVSGYIVKKLHDFIEEDAEISARNHAEEQRRTNTICTFEDGIAKASFERLVKNTAKSIKRISSITVDGPIVYGVVQSQSGISEWNFKIDYNDYGHITGRYWLSSDNDDSNIPSRLADMISSAIHGFSEDFCSIDTEKECYCPYCGKKQNISNATFCVHCGKRMI